MKKIALLTWFDNDNYGSALQAFALKHTLDKFGTCDVINYKTHSDKYKLSDLKTAGNRKIIFEKCITKLCVVLFKQKYTNYIIEKRSKFLSFFSDCLYLDKTQLTKSELKNLTDKYDYFVCGSDQVWSPLRYDSSFYLDFTSTKNKISYAPSFGVDNVKAFDTKTEEIRKNLAAFSNISVREDSGRNIVKQLIDKNVPVCLDPTLLLSEEEWSNFAEVGNNNLGEYIYGLFLGDYKLHRDSFEAISSKLNLPVYLHSYNRKDYFSNLKHLNGLGPSEFVSSIKTANFVCTDSFHAAVFSIIFHKPFILYKRFSDSDKNSQNTRVINLLRMLDLSERLDMVVKEETTSEHLLNIDYQKVNLKLDMLREESFSYLTNALK